MAELFRIGKAHCRICPPPPTTQPCRAEVWREPKVLTVYVVWAGFLNRPYSVIHIHIRYPHARASLTCNLARVIWDGTGNADNVSVEVLSGLAHVAKEPNLSFVTHDPV